MKTFLQLTFLEWLYVALLAAPLIGCTHKPDQATEALKEEASAASIDAHTTEPDTPVVLPKLDPCCGRECFGEHRENDNCLSSGCHCGDTCTCHVTGLPCCPDCPCCRQPTAVKKPADWREVYHAGRWWYYHEDKRWSVWDGKRWVAYRPAKAKPPGGHHPDHPRNLNWFGNPKRFGPAASLPTSGTTCRT